MNSRQRLPRSLVGLLLALACATGLLAQEAPEPAEASAPAGQHDATAGKPAPASEKTAVQPETATPDTFVPSEEVSEDLSVSFPVDI